MREKLIDAAIAACCVLSITLAVLAILMSGCASTIRNHPAAVEFVVVEEAADPDPEPYSVVEFWSGPNCPACSQWEQRELPALIKAGWAVEKLGAAEYPIPYFHVRVGRLKSEKVVGYMSGDRLREVLKGMGVEIPSEHQ